MVCENSLMMAAMQQNTIRLSPKWVSMANSSPLGNASTPSFRSVLINLRAWSTRGLRQELLFNELPWTITPDQITTLQPRHLPLLQELAGKHCKFFLTQSAKISSLGQLIKMLYQCDLQILWSVVVCETGRVVVSYVTGIAARSPELLGPTGI